jgi:hypothetical protein
MAIDLPDFDDLQGQIEDIGKLAQQKAELEIAIKCRESEITREATTDTKYFTGGKAPSQAFIDNAFKYTGFADELIPTRQSLAITEAQLEVARKTFDLMKAKIDVWRTQVANERASIS